MGAKAEMCAGVQGPYREAYLQPERARKIFLENKDLVFFFFKVIINMQQNAQMLNIQFGMFWQLHKFV